MYYYWHLLIPFLLKGIYFMCQDYSSDKNIQGNKQSQTGLALPYLPPPPPIISVFTVFFFLGDRLLRKWF